MVAFDKIFPWVHTDMLFIPDSLEVTNPDKRGWFVSPLGSENPIPIWSQNYKTFYNRNLQMFVIS
jgi:hypothetical protein